MILLEENGWGLTNLKIKNIFLVPFLGDETKNVTCRHLSCPMTISFLIIIIIIIIL